MSDVNNCLYKERKNSILNIVFDVLIVIVIAVLIIEIAFGSKYTGIYVIGPSMEPTLTGAPVTGVNETPKPGGSYVYVDRYASPDYSDIVVVYKNDGSTIIKRVIAKGGDRVYLERGVLYLKKSGSDAFEIVTEDYIAPENNTPALLKNTFPYTDGYLDREGFLVEEDCLFLLGDNRNVSADSRQDGGICYPVSSVYGVVAKWSLNNLKFISAMHQYFHFDLPGYFGIGQ